MRTWPYHHVEIPEWLPWRVYNELVAHWPHARMQNIADVRPVKGYSARLAYHENADPPTQGPWADLYEAMRHNEVMEAWVSLFREPLRQRFPTMLYTVPDSLLCEDREGYSIGPHTDSPAKVMSLVAYFPRAPAAKALPRLDYDWGTSVYHATDGFTCPGGPHHDRHGEGGRFEEVFRARYAPNSLFCFCKDEKSFHGVEPLPPGADRRVYIWNVRTSPL